MFNLCRRLRGLTKSKWGSVPRADARGYVRLKARVVGEVKVLFRHTLSGL